MGGVFCATLIGLALLDPTRPQEEVVASRECFEAPEYVFGKGGTWRQWLDNFIVCVDDVAEKKEKTKP
jgi:hypothetical protein